MSIAYPLLFVFPFIMLYAAAMDVLTMRIANTISIVLAASFFLVAAIAGMPMQQMLVHLGVGLAVLIANMVLFQLRLVGGGDAKLLAAAAFASYVPARRAAGLDPVETLKTE